MIALWLLAALGCKDKRSPQTPMDDLFDFTEQVRAEPSGTLTDGRFEDATYGVSIDVPTGWAAELGTVDNAMRVRLLHSVSGAIIELWAFNGRLMEPAPRPGGTWSFQDTGPYGVVPTAELLMVATNTPDDPEGARVFAWLIDGEGVTWQVELHTPADRLSVARRAGEEVLRTLRL